MNVKEYISSGILELYVLGSLSLKEQEEVELMFAKHPELLEEVQRIEADLKVVAESNAPSSLNTTILSGALEQIEGKQASSTVEVPKETKVRKLDSSGNNRLMNFALIAASVALLISLGVNYKFYVDLTETETQLANLRNENSVFAEDLQIQTTRFEETKNQLLALSDPNTKKVGLKGIEGKEGAAATVFWNVETKQTYIAVSNLPEPPEGMQYQLWALADGVPIDAGVFDVNGEIQLTKKIDVAQTFAVTLEEEGGKPTPNLEQLYVIGNVLS